MALSVANPNYLSIRLLRQFTSKKLSARCKEKKKLFPYFKDLYIANIELTTNIMLQSDLGYTAIVASNYDLLGLNDETLKGAIIASVRARINDLNPDITYKLAYVLQNIVSANDGLDLYQYLYRFIEERHFYFTYKQLTQIEHIFYVMARKFTFDFKPIFKSFLNYSIAEFGQNSNDKTRAMINDNSIQIPKEHIDLLYVSSKQNVAHIKFKKLNKMLTLVGLSKINNGVENMAKVKDLMKDRDYDFYILQRPPLTKREFNMNRVKTPANAYQDKLQRIIGENFLDINNTKKHHNLELFDKYEKLPIFDKEQVHWYINTILKNKDIYNINEAESVVFV